MAAAQPGSGGLGGGAHQGDFSRGPLRHLTARKGKKRAIVAVAHTLLVSRYYLLKNQQPYQELGAEFFDRRHAEHVTRYLLKRLERLGLQFAVRSSEHAAALLA